MHQLAVVTCTKTSVHRPSSEKSSLVPWCACSTVDELSEWSSMRIDERKKPGDDREAMLGVVGRPDEGRAFGQVTDHQTLCLGCECSQPRAFCAHVHSLTWLFTFYRTIVGHLPTRFPTVSPDDSLMKPQPYVEKFQCPISKRINKVSITLVDSVTIILTTTSN
jgi:hypothetical protein